MEKLKYYLKEVLGISITLEPVESLQKLPFYIREGFKLYYARFYNSELIFAEVKNEQGFTTSQVEKHTQFLKEIFNRKTVLVINDLTGLDRKRLIEKGINFIVPGKQLFLPDLFIDLRETYSKRKPEKKKLLPSAQFILLYKILHRRESIEQYTFKQLAEKLNYTQMGISKAVDNLKYHDLCNVRGTKEKYLHIAKPITELWHDSLPIMVNPVIKRVYVDELPETLFLFRSNNSALPEYTDIAPGYQEYRAVEKTLFYSMEKNKQWINLNEKEGRYCLEIWKYDPGKLAEGITQEANVDPLSLYLSLKESRDERIEIALEQIIEKYIW